MRRRLTDAHTGLGNPSPEIFDNQWTESEEFNNAAKAFFDDILKDVKDFKELGGFDFSMSLKDDGFRIILGLEPSYKYDPYIYYCFDSNKDEICIKKGKANGYYGSDIVITSEKKYSEPRFNKAFKKCIDTHYDNLVACLQS